MTHYSIKTYGAKYGSPQGQDHQDVRHLRNPFKVQALRQEKGTCLAVQDYVRADPSFEAVIDLCREQLNHPGHEVSIFCHGGRHRSVAVAEVLYARLVMEGHTVTIHHRELDRVSA